MIDQRAHLDELVAYFRQLGFHSEILHGDAVVVAAQPEVTNGITVYRRSAYAVPREDGSWCTTVRGIRTGESLSLAQVQHLLTALMHSSDVAYETEFRRRAKFIGSENV